MSFIERIKNNNKLKKANREFSRTYKKIKREKQGKKSLSGQIKSIRVDTFTKALVAIITIVALIDLQLGYLLAFLDKIQIAESLSTQICITILGVAFVYMIRAYFDSKAECDSEITKEELNEAALSEAQNILSRAGININLQSLINNSSNNNPCNNNESNNIVG